MAFKMDSRLMEPSLPALEADARLSRMILRTSVSPSMPTALKIESSLKSFCSLSSISSTSELKLFSTRKFASCTIVDNIVRKSASDRTDDEWGPSPAAEETDGQ